MTWVVAQPTIFGYSTCISDIQVTFEDQNGKKTYKDCLQKVHAMDKNIIAAFAGNVLGGFVMLSSLSKTIKEEKRTDQSIEPEYLIEKWSVAAKDTYGRLKPEAKEGGIAVLIAGVSHSMDLGIPGMGKPTVATLRYPNFKPNFAKIGSWISIGSGTYVRRFKNLLNNLPGNSYNEMMRGELAFSGGFGHNLASSIAYDVQKGLEVKGISKHFHFAQVSRMGTSLSSSDHDEFPMSGNKIEIRMPKVVKSLDEFLRLVEKLNKTGTLAICGNAIHSN